MKKLNPVLLACSFCVLNNTAQADTPFVDSIPLDVAEALFDFGIGGGFIVYSDIMDDFPALELPDGFEVVGSLVQNTQKRVVLATSLDQESANEAIITTYLDDGWVELPQVGPPRQETGFISASNPRPMYQSICHDEHGQMMLNHRERSPQNHLVLSLSIRSSFNRGWQSCDDLIAQQEMSYARMGTRGTGVQQYMPRLELPEGTTQGGYQPFFIGGGGGGNNSYETDATVEIEMDLDEVFQHFAEQITEQGWALDVESIGSATATGSWTKLVEDETTIVGRLNVVRSDDNVYDLSMQVEIPGGSRSGARVFSN